MGKPKFSVGQVIHHLKYDYRGVIVQVDPTFSQSDEWYEKVARSKPPKDQPWYRVLVDDADHETYVAERHLELDTSGLPVTHPALRLFFEDFRDDRYIYRMVN